MANFDLLIADIGSGVWGTPANFNGFRVWLHYCSDVAHRRPTKLCTMLVRLLGWYRTYTVSGAVALTEFCPVQKSLYVQVLRSPILAALLHGTRAVSISQTLRRGTRNGITEHSQGRHPHLYSAGRPPLWASAHILVLANYGRPA